uniref:Uncharacterized protein n=1 Tax=Lygus hesperus TaxID=30085 RepID=A0A146L6T8_LYGHE
MSHKGKPVTLPDGQVIYANIEDSDLIDLNPQVILDRIDISDETRFSGGECEVKYEIHDGSYPDYETRTHRKNISDFKMEVADEEIDSLSEAVENITTCEVKQEISKTPPSPANMDRIEMSSDEEFKGFGLLHSPNGMEQGGCTGQQILLRDQKTLLDCKGKASQHHILLPKTKSSEQHTYSNKESASPELHRKTIATSPFRDIEASLGTNPLVLPEEDELTESDIPQIVSTSSLPSNREPTPGDEVTVVNDDSSRSVPQPKATVKEILRPKPRYTGTKLVHLQEACCLVDKLVKRKFLSDAWWSAGEREKIVTDGKPTVNYDNVFGYNLNTCYSINLNRLKWLTGCVERQRLYCWPCLLFDREHGSTRGVFNTNQELGRILNCFKRHGDSQEHREAEVRERQWIKRNLDDIYKTQPGLTFKDRQSASDPPSEPTNLFSQTGNDRKSEKSYEQIKQNTPVQLHSYATMGMKSNNDHQKPCIIRMLLKKDFVSGSWQEGEQDAIVIQGRRCPSMEYIFGSGTSKHGEAILTDDLYVKHPWLTGSWETKNLYCWPCLLYDAQGSCLDFKGMSPATVIDNHELLNSHLESSICLKLLEHDIKGRCKKGESEQDIENVKKKREFLKHLIDVVCITKTTVNNSGCCEEDYVELLKLIASYNLNLEGFLHETSIATGKEAATYLVSNHAEGILTAITQVMVKKIKRELQNAPFVAIMLDDVKGLVNKSFISVIIRYVEKNGEVQERFVKFIEVGYNRSAGNMIRHVTCLVEELGCESRVVGITYDGAVIEPTDVKKFNSEVRSNINSAAMFFHNRNHNLKFLIQQALSHHKECRTFFQHLVPFRNFFNDTPAAINALIELDSKVPGDNSGRVWDFSIEFVNTIRCHYTLMLELLENINRHPNDWDIEHVVQAPYHIRFLKNLQNRFFIVFLSKVFSIVSELTAVLQLDFDVNNWTENTNQAKMQLSQMRDKLNDICEIACSPSLTENDMPRIEQVEALKEMNKELFNNLLTCIINFIVTRIENIDNFRFFDSDIISGIVDKSRDGTKEIIARLTTTYNSPVFNPLFNITKLRAQLDFHFGHKCFKTIKSINELMKDMHEFEMSSTMTELHRLLRLILTIPIASHFIEKTNSHENIATYVKSNINDLNTIDAFVWLEKDLLESLQKEENFHEWVIAHYAKKPGGEQFRLPINAKKN